MSPEKQVEMWVKGESIHNEERDECCPDFSCCDKSLMAKESVRLRFAKAEVEGNEAVKTELLAMFLGRLLKRRNINAYVIG